MLGRQIVPDSPGVRSMACLQLHTRRRSSKAGAAPRRADLQPQRERLLAEVRQDQSLPAMRAAIQQSARALADTHDWQQLSSMFAAASLQQRSPAAAGGPPPRSTGGGWGFALRQPSRPSPAAAANAPLQQPPAHQPLHWQSIKHFQVLGLGSVTALTAAPSRSHQQAPPPSSRLGFRLMQLSLAVALVQHMLPGLSSTPVAFDPGFEPDDVELLEGLGFVVPASQPSHTAAGPTLLYMPCCPRQLYSDVLAANWGGQLQQLAILGTSMSSLSNTQSLFTALVAEGEGPPQSMLSSQPAGQLGSPGGQQADMVSLAYTQGRVVEMPCPDYGAHGVGVSLHVFR